MNKKILALVLGICTAMTVVGCGQISNDTITIKKYKGLEVEAVEAIRVTDEDVEQSIESTLDILYLDVKEDRPVQDQDQVIIDFVGTKDGVPFDGGSSEDYTLMIGSNSFIDGFETGIIGHKKGETFPLNLTFPEDYHSEEMAGQAVVFTVTVKKIQYKPETRPELTDELVVEYLSKTAKTVEEYKKEVRADLKKSNEESAKSQYQSNAWQELLKNCEMKEYPEDELKERVENLENQYSYPAAMMGIDVDTYFQQAVGMTVEEYAKEAIKQENAYQLIVKKERMKITDEEYEKGVEEIAERYGYTKEEIESVGKETVEQTLLFDKVSEFLVKHAKEKK